MAIISDYTDASGDTVCSGVVVDDDSSTGLKLKSATASSDVIVRNRTGDFVVQFDGADAIMITPTGGLARKVTNKSGGTLNKGDVVVWDTTTDDSVISTATQNDIAWSGVIYETIPVDTTGWMVFKGRALTTVVGTPARGTLLGCSATTRKAEDTAPGPLAVIGPIISTVTSGQAWVEIR